MASPTAAVPQRATRRPPYETIVAICGLLALPLWIAEIHRAFGLPAHPLILHVPVIFVPILGLAVRAVAVRPSLMERHGTLIAAFSVVTMAATLLTVGPGEAFR